MQVRFLLTRRHYSLVVNMVVSKNKSVAREGRKLYVYSVL